MSRDRLRGGQCRARPDSGRPDPHRRDLLESIVLPSASFVRSYEPVQVQTVDGKVYSGVVRGDSARELTLATGAKEQVRIPREEIDQMQPGKVSIMPTGLDKQLSHQELADLVAFLKACR